MRQVTSDLEVGFLNLEKGKTGEELSKYMAFTFLHKGRYFTKTQYTELFNSEDEFFLRMNWEEQVVEYKVNEGEWGVAFRS